jgi:hypothetical protein
MSSTFGGSRSSAELPVVIAGARHPNRGSRATSHANSLAGTLASAVLAHTAAWDGQRVGDPMRGSPFASFTTKKAEGAGAKTTPTRSLPVGISSFTAVLS